MELNRLQESLNERILRFGPGSVVNLIDSNFLDNGFLFPPELLRQGQEDWLATRSYHPDAKGKLPSRQAIAGFFRNGGPVSRPLNPILTESELTNLFDPESIILTASSSESYNLLFQTFCQPGDNILLPQPGYPLFEDLAEANHLETRFYPLAEGLGWQPDIDILESLIDHKTKFLILISPNNPCGSLLSATILESIAVICERHRIMIISDEVFSEFLYSDNCLFPRACVIARNIPVFTINGISKMFALPDLKLSWLLITGPNSPTSGFLPRDTLVNWLALRNDTFLNCNSCVQHMLPGLFEYGVPFVQNMVAALKANRMKLENQISNSLPSGVRISLPEAGIHCIIGLSPYAFLDDETVALSLLQNQGIYLHPGYLYGIDDEPALVMSLLKPPEVFNQTLAQLIAGLSL